MSQGPGLDAFFDASPNAYVVLDRELRVVHANRAYLALTGTTLDALVGQVMVQAFPNDADDPNDESRRMLATSLRRVIDTGKPDHLAVLPYRVARAPGEAPVMRTWSATHTPILDATGRTTHVLQHTEDVSELQHTAKSVIERASQVQRSTDETIGDLRALFQQTPGFTAFMRGPEHVFELSNPGYTALVGGRDVIGKSVREALPEIAGQGFYELLDQVFATGEPFVGRGLSATLQANGAPYTVYVDFVYQPIFGRDGKPIGILVQGHDITEERLAQQRQQFISRATELFGTGLDPETALAGIAQAVVKDVADWSVVDLFEGDRSRRIAVAHADPAKAELAKQFFAHPLPAEIPANHVYHERKGAVLVRTVTREELLTLGRGAEHSRILAEADFDSFVMVPLWHQGRLYGMFVAHTAHTGKAFDDRIVPVMTELGRLASTALDNARLGREREALLSSEHAARERAESANHAKDQFIALLGHELRNPLAPILSAVQLLRLRGTASREAEVIERQTNHLVRLVDDLLDMSRIVHGKVELRRERVVVSEVIAKAVELAAPLLDAKAHLVSVRVDPELALVADAVRLAQVVANLLTNAARYTPEHGQIEVEAHRDGEAARIRVRDNGIGIAPDVLPTVFDMFVQAPQASDRKVGGLGLGLTLVRELVALHGGTVEAHSAGLGHGTEVIVRIPLTGEAPVAVAPPAIAPAAPTGSRVLIVDDNVDAASLLGDLLATRHHACELAHDGESALALLGSHAFDIALIDIGLPRMDGHALARVIRERIPHPPRLIALTGYGSADDRARSADAGFSAHLTKPVDLATLLGLIDA